MNWTAFWNILKNILQAAEEALKGDAHLQPPPTPPVMPQAPSAWSPPPPKYQWDTPDHVRHSIRVICDEEKMTLEQKNTMTATIHAESEFNTHAINRNKNAAGRVLSTDRGLCQWNDFYHSTEITPDEALNNPEKAVRLMCAYWKRGQRTAWVAFKSGAYKKYL